MKRAAVLYLCAALGFTILVGCGPEPPKVQTAPASRRFLKKPEDQPDRVPTTENQPPLPVK